MQIWKKYAVGLGAVLTTLSIPAAAQNLFFDDFNGGAGSNPSSTNWVERSGSNGSFFGCTFDPARSSRSGTGNLLLTIVSGRCGEVKSARTLSHGKYFVTMTPSRIGGTNSSFFLYRGTTGGASNHYEIDIEFLNGGRTLHTNYFIAGSDNNGGNVRQFTVNQGLQRVGFQWSPTSIRWFSFDLMGRETNLRTVNVAISGSMNLFLNHWNSNSSNADSVGFLGSYNGNNSTATYHQVRVTR